MPISSGKAVVNIGPTQVGWPAWVHANVSQFYILRKLKHFDGAQIGHFAQIIDFGTKAQKVDSACRSE